VRSFALPLLLLSSGVQAGSVDGTLLVSATVVATCAIETSVVTGWRSPHPTAAVQASRRLVSMATPPAVSR
jgi:hypothetical protein